MSTEQTLETIKHIVGGTADSDLANNNANKASEQIQVMRDFIAGEACKLLAPKWLPERTLEAHKAGDIHFHDLDYSPLMPMPNCCLLDISEMFKGFKMGAAEIETPKSISTAMAVLVQIIANISSVQYGGISIDDIDNLMAPYVDKSYYKHLEVGKQWCGSDAKAVAYATERTHREVKDACQALEYELNTLYTSNG